MAITYVGKSSAMDSGSGAISVAVPSTPASYQQNDILVLILQGRSAIPAEPSGWTTISTKFYDAKAYMRVCWKLATASESAVSVADSGDSTRGVMLAFRDCDTTNPINSYSTGESWGTSYTAQNGLTTTVDDCMVVTCVGFYDGDTNDTDNYSSWTNASLTSITEGHDQSTNAGLGGGITFAYGTDSVAGAVNATTATTDTSINYSVTIMIALKPASTLLNKNGTANITFNSPATTTVTSMKNGKAYYQDIKTSDSFNRVDSSSMGNADTGEAWNTWQGSMGIVSNKCKALGSASSNRTTIDTGLSNYDLSCDVTQQATKTGMSIDTRTDGSDANRIVLYLKPDGVIIEMWRFVSGGSSQIGGDYAMTWTTDVPKNIRLRLSGSSIKFWLDGTLVYDITNSSALDSNTKITLATETDHGGTFENLIVREIGSGILGITGASLTSITGVRNIEGCITHPTNLIPNPKFGAGHYNGWSRYGSYGVWSIVNERLVGMRNSLAPYIGTETSWNIPIGHKLYIRFKHRANRQLDNCRFWCSTTLGQNSTLNQTYMNIGTEWSTFSVIGTTQTDVTNLFALYPISQQPGDWTEYDDIVLVDLTTDYGSGNEPTLEWCDTNIKDTIYVASSTIVLGTKQENSNNINGTALMTHPQRTASDVYNKVINGYFETTASWTPTTASVSAVANEMSFLATAQYGRILQSYANYADYANHVIYIRANVWSNYAASKTKLAVYDGVGTGAWKYHSTTAGYQVLSAIYTVASAPVKLDLRVQDEQPTSGWVTQKVKDMMLFDLTAIFGGGNEPIKTWCDDNLLAYLENLGTTGKKNSQLNAQLTGVSIIDIKGWTPLIVTLDSLQVLRVRGNIISTGVDCTPSIDKYGNLTVKSITTGSAFSIDQYGNLTCQSYFEGQV